MPRRNPRVPADFATFWKCDLARFVISLPFQTDREDGEDCSHRSLVSSPDLGDTHMFDCNIFFVKAAVTSKGEMDVYKYVIHIDHIEVILCVPRSARLASKSCPP